MTSNTDNPEVLAVVPLPSAAERRRRQIMRARVMLVAIDIILAGDHTGWETPVRQLKSLPPPPAHKTSQ